MRVVLEMAGIKNAFGKQLGSGNPLNNARATIEGLRAQRTLPQVAAERGLTVQELMGFTPGAPGQPSLARPTPLVCSAVIKVCRLKYSGQQSPWASFGCPLSCTGVQ